MAFRNLKATILLAAGLIGSITANAALVDTDGNAATNETLLGHIDMGVSTVGDLDAYISDGLATTNDVKLTAAYGNWVCTPATIYDDDDEKNVTLTVEYTDVLSDHDEWVIFGGAIWEGSTGNSDLNATNLTAVLNGITVKAVRPLRWILGDQTGKPLQPAGNYADVSSTALTVVNTNGWKYYQLGSYSNELLQSALTFDTAPTAESNNPITSGGVKSALDGVSAKTNLTSLYEDTWICSGIPSGWVKFSGDPIWNGDDAWVLRLRNASDDSEVLVADGTASDLSLDFGTFQGSHVTAARQGTQHVLYAYTLGTQTDKPLAPAGDYATASDVAAKQDVLPYATNAIPSSAISNPQWSWASITNKPSWIGSTKPTYTASEVGAIPSTGPVGWAGWYDGTFVVNPYTGAEEGIVAFPKKAGYHTVAITSDIPSLDGLESRTNDWNTAAAWATTNYLPLSGGTVTGNLKVFDSSLSVVDGSFSAPFVEISEDLIVGGDTLLQGAFRTSSVDFDNDHRLDLQNGQFHLWDDNDGDDVNIYFPKKSGTVALTSDMPSLSGLESRTNDWNTAAAWATTNYLPLTGGTVTGDVSMGANLTIEEVWNSLSGGPQGGKLFLDGADPTEEATLDGAGIQKGSPSGLGVKYYWPWGGNSATNRLAAIPDIINATNGLWKVVAGMYATRAASPTAGHLAALDSQGNPTDSQIPVADVAQKTDTVLTQREHTYSEWDVDPATVTVGSQTYTAVVYDKVLGDVHYWCVAGTAGSSSPFNVQPYDATATNLIFTMPDGFSPSSLIATRTRIDRIGYTLGTQTDKPLQPAGDYATASDVAAKQDKLPYATNAIPQAAVSGLADALAGKAAKAPTPTANHLAALDASGNPIDSGIAKSEVAKGISVGGISVSWSSGNHTYSWSVVGKAQSEVYDAWYIVIDETGEESTTKVIPYAINTTIDYSNLTYGYKFVIDGDGGITASYYYDSSSPLSHTDTLSYDETLSTAPRYGVAVATALVPSSVDSTPTANSGNFVTSGGTKTALDGKQDKLPYATNAIPQAAVSGLASALAGKASTADVVLNGGSYAPTFELTAAQKESFAQTEGASDNDYQITFTKSSYSWALDVGSYHAASCQVDPNDSTRLLFDGGDARLGKHSGDLVGTASSYVLGNQTTKPLQPAGDYATVSDVAAKQDKLPYATNAIPSSAISNPQWSWASITNKPSWIGSTKPTYTASEVGAFPGEDSSASFHATETGFYRNGANFNLPSGDGALASGTLAITADIATATNAVTADLQVWTTNMTVVGYTEWAYSGDTSPSATYTINMTSSGGNFLFTLYDPAEVGTVTTNILNPTVLVYPVTGGSITASRNEIRRNSRGFAMYSDVQTLRQDVEDMDTSYFRFNQITNVNQSVQYVYTDSTTTELSIQMPATGMTKDWLVYVLAETNLVLHLPPATYWVANDTVTNSIPAYTPTALYFTQITEDTFSIGRKEFIPVTVQTPMALSLQKARDKKRGRGYASALAARRPTPPTPAAPAQKKKEEPAKAAETKTEAKK